MAFSGAHTAWAGKLSTILARMQSEPLPLDALAVYTGPRPRPTGVHQDVVAVAALTSRKSE